LRLTWKTGNIAENVITRLIPSLMVLLIGCKTTQDESTWKRYEFNEPEMGVNFVIKLYAPDEVLAKNAARAVYDRIEVLNSIFSNYDPASELNRLTRNTVGKAVKVSSELFAVLHRAQILSLETNGAFDVTMGPYIELWRKARRQKQLTDPELLRKVSKSVGYQNLDLIPHKQSIACMAPGLHLNLGGIAKGWAVDEALEILRAHGIRRALCAASGDIAIGGAPPNKKGWLVGVRSVDRQGNFYDQMLNLKNCAVSTSGDTFQFIEINGKRYSHIIDPRTGYGLTNRVMVTVITSSAVESDSKATAISVLGLNSGIAYAKKKDIAIVITPLTGEKRAPQVSPKWKNYLNN